MKNWSIKGRANAVLALSATGILAAFPFQHSFAGGLLFAAFSAGTIGGLADSFAISALFGNPLRIRWPRWMGTHIISRNRERLIGELVDMVENELLTATAIRATLKDHDLGDVVVGYLTERGGSEDVHIIAQKLFSELLDKADPEQLAAGLNRLIEDHADALQASDLLADIGDWTLRNEYDDRIISFVVQPFIQLVQTASFRLIIEQVVQSAIKSYEGDKFRRRLVDYTAGLSASAISGKVQDWLAAFLVQFASEDHPQRQRFKTLLQQFVRRLREDDALRSQVERGKRRLIEAIGQHVRLDEFLLKRIESARAALQSPRSESRQEQGAAFGWLSNEIDNGLEQLASNPELRRSLDKGIKSLLLSWVEEKHALIGRLVREKLESFSEHELIELVKEKAGRDLQYIRLNGMIVGALVGAVLYLLTFWIGGKG